MYKEIEKYELGSGVVFRILKHIDAGIYVGTGNCSVGVQANGWPIVGHNNVRTAPGSYVKVMDELKQIALNVNGVLYGPLYNKMK